MDKPKKIFIDTSAWIAHLLKNELHHQLIRATITHEAEAGGRFFTSDYVLDETYTRLLTGQSPHAAKQFHTHIQAAVKQKKLLILQTDQTVTSPAWNHFIKFAEHKLSFTDATIIALVQDLNLDLILTLDHGFQKAGQKTIPDLKQ